MGFIKEQGYDTPCLKVPSLIKKNPDFCCSNRIILGRQGKVNLNTDGSPSGERDGIFSMFTDVVRFFLGCSVLGFVLQGQSTANPTHGNTSKCPKPDVKRTWAVAGSLREFECFLTWGSSKYFSINCVSVV